MVAPAISQLDAGLPSAVVTGRPATVRAESSDSNIVFRSDSSVVQGRLQERCGIECGFRRPTRKPLGSQLSAGGVAFTAGVGTGSHRPVETRFPVSGQCSSWVARLSLCAARSSIVVASPFRDSTEANYNCTIVTHGRNTRSIRLQPYSCNSTAEITVANQTLSLRRLCDEPAPPRHEYRRTGRTSAVRPEGPPLTSFELRSLLRAHRHVPQRRRRSHGANITQSPNKCDDRARYPLFMTVRMEYAEQFGCFESVVVARQSLC